MKPYVPTNSCFGYTFFAIQDSVSVIKVTQSLIFFFNMLSLAIC